MQIDTGCVWGHQLTAMNLEEQLNALECIILLHYYQLRLI